MEGNPQQAIEGNRTAGSAADKAAQPNAAADDAVQARLRELRGRDKDVQPVLRRRGLLGS